MMVMNRALVFELDTLLVEQYDPPAEYDVWWEEVKQCTELDSGIEVRAAWGWLTMPGDAFTIAGDGPFGGWTSTETHAVVILQKYRNSKRLVQHEMVHVLMHENNLKTGHDSGHFEMCGLQAQ
ncbi:MAG: hypothetical protein H0W74_14060 [Sphingosinicella sp.]|nr:hypothetical protein [Sphingosinicella sp.]